MSLDQPAVDFGRRYLRIGTARVAALIPLRAIIVSVVLVVVILAVTLLAGTCVAAAGPIAFVGIMIPHVVRWFTGPDQRWVLVYSMLVGPIFLLLADILGRVVLPNGELRVGIVTGILGAPVLIALVRRKQVSGL